jgi:hypothetical protein
LGRPCNQKELLDTLSSPMRLPNRELDHFLGPLAISSSRKGPYAAALPSNGLEHHCRELWRETEVHLADRLVPIL